MSLVWVRYDRKMPARTAEIVFSRIRRLTEDLDVDVIFVPDPFDPMSLSEIKKVLVELLKKDDDLGVKIVPETQNPE